MDVISIIVDRVQQTNVFNVIQGRMPSRDTHLKSIVDDDLLQEYLREIDRLSRMSHSGGHSHTTSAAIPARLRSIGETFFMQIFPREIQDRLRDMDRGYLYLHVDTGLRNIPWELLHDGQCFLGDKFFIGKNIAGCFPDAVSREKGRLSMLIVADPTEDLEWARREGEELYRALYEEVDRSRLDLQILAGSQITKLSLLDAIRDRDIIHYSGHLFYSEELQESGWLLSDGKILRAREIEKAGLSPELVFSNSCFSSPVLSGNGREETLAYRFNDLAGAFLNAGIRNYIGTNWEITDSINTFEFALDFYRGLFNEKSIGESLYEARRNARQLHPADDLTWANYVLHGNPLMRIFRSVQRKKFDPSGRAQVVRKIIDHYPTPIARAYAEFQGLAEESPSVRIFSLCSLFKISILTIGSIIFSNYRFLNMKGHIPESPKAPPTLEEWIEYIYSCLSGLGTLHLELTVPGLLETMYMHRDSIQKMVQWRTEFVTGRIHQDSADSYLVTFQYLLDNFLFDLQPLSKHHILFIPEDYSEGVVVLNGRDPHWRNIIPPEYTDYALEETFLKSRGVTIFYSRSGKTLFALDPYLRFDPATSDVNLFPLEEGRNLNALNSQKND